MTRRLSRRWRVVKWLGLILCGLIGATWGLSLPGWLAYRRHPYTVWLPHGAVNFVVSKRPTDSRPQGLNWGWRNPRPSAGSLPRLVAWTWNRPRYWNIRSHMAISIPLLPTLVGFAVATVYLWWRDRRYPKGHCQSCIYDLTGNTSGVCPECGERI